MRKYLTEAKRIQAVGEKMCDSGQIKEGAPKSMMAHLIRAGFEYTGTNPQVLLMK